MNTKGKLISIFIVLTMIVSIISTNMYSAFAEETDYITAEENNLKISLTNKSGVPLGGENSPSISNGDEIIINLGFEIKNNNVGKDTLCIDLSKLEFIKDLLGGTCFTPGNDNVGSFTVEGDKVYIKYKWDELKKCFPNSSEYSTTVSINGKANYSDDNIGSDGKIKFIIKNQEISVPSVSPDSNIKLEKTRLGDGKNNNENVVVIDNETYQKFQIKATSNGGSNTNVVLNDELHSSNLSFVESGTMAPTMTVDNQTVSLDSSNFSVNGQTATFKIGNLDKDKEAIITYWVKIGSGAYSEGTDKRYNTLQSSFTNNNGESVSSNPSCWTEVKVNNIYVDKYAQDKGTNAGKKEVEWTISVTGGDLNNGYKFKDEETGSGDIVHGKLKSHSNIVIKRDNEEIGTITYDQLNSLTISDEDDLTNNKIKLGKGEKLTLTYTNTYEISTVDISTGYFTKNKVEVKKDNFPTSEKEAWYTIVPVLNVSINKSFTNYDLKNKKISWKVDVKVPADFTKLKLNDFVGQGHEMILDSLKINNEKKNFIQNEDGSYSVDLTDITNYEVEGSYHKYTFTYDTKDLLTDLQLINKASISYEYNNNSGKADSEVITYDKNPIISKSGESEWVNGIANGVQKWRVKFNLQVINLQNDKNTLKITDTLPENLELVKNSFKLGNEDVNLNITNNGQVFEADITNILREYTKNHPNEKEVELTYKTKFIDLDKGITGKNLINQIQANYNGQVAEPKEGTTWAEFNPGGVLSKSMGNYNIQNPTTLSYTIEVNKTATQLAPDNETTLQVVDTLGSALKYNENGIKIVKVDMNNSWKEIDITDQCNIAIDQSKNTMTIDVPDKTYLKITYTCQINLPSGTKIDDSSSQELKDSVSNKVTLQGTRNLNRTENKVFKGEIKSASSTTHPINCSLQINKVDSSDNQKKLKGATFKIYMVKVVNGKFEKVNKDEVHSYGGSQEKTTDNNGELVFNNLMFDQYYCYEEIGNPKGYTGTVKGYVLFDGNEPKQNVESEIPEGTKLQRVYNYIGSISIDVKNKKVDTGELKITKTISGISSQTDLEKAKSSIKFKVTSKNNSDQVNEYTLNDFEYNESTKKWELKLNKEVGEYTVEEVVSDVDGYTLKETTYTVNSSASVDGKAKVEKEKTTEVDFKNTYEQEKHNVVISKIDATSKLMIAGAKLQILNKDNTKVAHWESVEGKTKSLELAPGTYTLKEKEAPAGYKIANPIQFTVTKDGNVKIGDTVVDQVVMEDSKTSGKLTITKTLLGIPNDDAKNKIKFVVTNNATSKSTTYRLDDFEYDETNNIWKKTLDVVEGGYTVEEIVEDSAGYQLELYSYQVTQNNLQQNKVLEKKNTNVEVKDNQETTIAFTNSYKLKKHDVKISKQDLISGDNIEGASLQIKNKDTNEITNIVSTNQDQIVKLTFGNYILTEILAPNGYKIAPSIEFTVTKDGKVKVNGNEVEKVIMKDQPIGKLIITKTIKGDLTKEQAKNSIKFKVTNNKTNEENTYLLENFNYNENTKTWTKELTQVAGGYTVEELVTSIKGHKLSLTQYQINEDGTIKKVTDKKAENVIVKKGKTTFIEFENNYDLDVYDVEIEKTDISGTKEVNGAKLKVIDANEIVETWTSGQNGEKTHKLKLVPGKYTLIEESAPYGYRKAQNIEFIVDENGKIVGTNSNKVIMKDENTQGKLILTKTIEGNISKEEAKNITFKVTNQQTNKSEEYTLDKFDYDEANKTWTKELDVLAGQYTVEETNSSIPGYTVTTVYTVGNKEEKESKAENVQVDDQGETTIAFTNSYKLKKSDVKISKQDLISGDNIVGASLQIKNKDTNEITNIVSTNQDQTVQLTFGNYILTEILAPNGYKIAPSIEFTVTKDGKIMIDGNEVEKVIMKDQPVGKLMIIKTIKGDLTKEQAESSIKFEVTNNDSKDKKEYALSDFAYDGNNWKLELEENTGGYTVKEVVSDVDGYTLKETTYTVGNDTESGKKVSIDIEKGKTTTVAFENTYERTRYEVNIDKVDDSNEKLMGAKLQVLDETGQEVDNWTTDGTTHLLRLLPGTYTLHEIKAPEGYLTAEDITFVVGNDGKIVDHKDNIIVMKDQEKPGKLMITKTIKGDLAKEQAEKSIKFEVTNNDSKDKKEYALSDFTYDGNNWKLELEENTGGYTVKEVVNNVEGYTLKETTYTVGNDTESGKKVSIDIEKGKTTTVAFENTYEKVDIPPKEDDTPNNENKDSSNDQPQVVSNDPKKNSSQKNNKQSTKTGDESALLENMALMIVSLFGVLKGCKVYYKRKEC